MRKVIFPDEMSSFLDAELKITIKKFLDVLDAVDVGDKQKQLIRTTYLDGVNSFNRLVQQKLVYDSQS